MALLCAPAWADAPAIRLIADTSELDLAFIRGGELVTNLSYANPRGVIARYTGVDLCEAPRKVTCTARFIGGGSVAIVATPSADWSINGITACSIHAVFSSDAYHFGFYEDGALTDVLADEYTLDLTGETAYTFGFSIDGSTITLQLPNGKKVKKRDDRVKTLNGQHIIFEHYLTPEEAEAGSMPAILSIYAKGKSLAALEDDFARPDGLPIAAPSGHTYYQFRND